MRDPTPYACTALLLGAVLLAQVAQLGVWRW